MNKRRWPWPPCWCAGPPRIPRRTNLVRHTPGRPTFVSAPRYGLVNTRPANPLLAPPQKVR